MQDSSSGSLHDHSNQCHLHGTEARSGLIGFIRYTVPCRLPMAYRRATGNICVHGNQIYFYKSNMFCSGFQITNAIDIDFYLSCLYIILSYTQVLEKRTFILCTPHVKSTCIFFCEFALFLIYISLTVILISYSRIYILNHSSYEILQVWFNVVLVQYSVHAFKLNS